MKTEQTIECHICKKKKKGATKHVPHCLRLSTIFWKRAEVLSNGYAMTAVPQRKMNLTSQDWKQKSNVLTKMIQTMSTRTEKLEECHTGGSLDGKVEEKVEKKVAEIFEEAQEREKRKLNTIVSNSPESMNETPEERKEDDLAMIRKIVGKISDMPENEIDNPVRLAQVRVRKNSKPRLLRLEAKSEKSKKSITENIYQLKAGVMDVSRSIYINNDSTPKDREQFTKLREAKKRRTDEGETDLVIRGRKVVKRPSKESAHGATSQGTDCHWQNAKAKTNYVNNFNASTLNEDCIFLYTSIDSFLNKRSKFLTVIDERKPMIIDLTEIKAKNKEEVNLSEYSFPGYDLFVNEQPKRGVSVYTSKKLNALKCEELSATGFEDSVWCSFTNAK